MKLNEKLTELRKAKGLTQHETAEALGVSRQAVSRWEVGTAAPTLDNLSSLSRLYDVPLDYFIQEEAGTKVQEIVPADVSPAVPVKSGRSYVAPVCSFLAVLILGVGILIGVSMQLKLEPDGQGLPNTTGGSDVSVSDAANDRITIFTPNGSYTYNTPSRIGPDSSADIEIKFPNEEDMQEIETQIAAGQAEQEEARKNAPPRAKLSDEDARELAEQYNPAAMTQEQYDSILETLADKGVLTRDEIGYMGYKGRTVIDLDAVNVAMVIPMNDPMDQASRDLLWSDYSTGTPYGGTRFNNADGTYDVLAWADMMNTYMNMDTESWQGYHGALYDALDQVRLARESAKQN